MTGIIKETFTVSSRHIYFSKGEGVEGCKAPKEFEPISAYNCCGKRLSETFLEEVISGWNGGGVGGSHFLTLQEAKTCPPSRELLDIETPDMVDVYKIHLGDFVE